MHPFHRLLWDLSHETFVKSFRIVSFRDINSHITLNTIFGRNKKKDGKQLLWNEIYCLNNGVQMKKHEYLLTEICKRNESCRSSIYERTDVKHSQISDKYWKRGVFEFQVAPLIHDSFPGLKIGNYLLFVLFYDLLPSELIIEVAEKWAKRSEN